MQSFCWHAIHSRINKSETWSLCVQNFSFILASVANMHLSGSVEIDLAFMNVVRNLLKLIELGVSQSAIVRL